MTRLPVRGVDGTPTEWSHQQGHHLPANGGVESVAGFEMSDLFAFLMRRKWSIALGLASVIAAAAVYTQFMEPTYHSEVTFLVEAEGSGGGTGGLDILDQLGRGRQIETEIELIRSRRVLDPIVDSLFFHAAPLEVVGQDSQRLLFRFGEELGDGSYRVVREDESGGLTLRVDDTKRAILLTSDGDEEVLSEAELDTAVVELPTTLAERLVERAEWRSGALEGIEARLSVGRVQREADLIRLRCAGRTPRSAMRLCAGIEASYLELRHDLERAHASSTRQLLSEQLERVGEQLRVAEDELTVYRRRNRVVALDDRASAEVRQQTDLRAQRDVLEAERLALEEVLQLVETGGQIRYRELAAFPSFIGNETVTRLMASLVELENRRSELSVTLTDRHPELVALDQRIASIESQLHTTARSYETALATQVASLDATISGMGNRLSGIPEQRIAHARLEREAENLSDVYTMLEGRLQEARIAESVNLPTVRIVDSASLPVRPSSPNLKMNLILATIGGLAFGLGLALLREQLDPGLRGRHQVERETGLSVLSMVPHVGRPGPVLAFAQADPATSGGNGSALVRSSSAQSRKLKRAVEKAAALEAYRSLAVDLSFTARSVMEDGNGRGFRSLAVTSATRGEGKTLTACNLALVNAASGHRTLLIDTDIRASGVSRLFEFGADEPGLTDVLGDRRYDPRAVRREIRVEGGNVLSVIPAGPQVRQTASLFEGEAFPRLLADLSRSFDLIVFDTPPLSLITDATAVAASVEGVLVVVRSGVTEKETLDYTLQRIRRVNANVLGVVLNGVRARESYGSRDYYEHEVSRQGSV
jgi:capsular exopolysaccharide synthesis family protein